MKKIIVVSTNDYFKKKIRIKNVKFFFLKKQSELSLKNLKRLNPNIIFFPYWHWKVDSNILERFLCIGFHTAPLPYGRGGSPVQNQIIRGKKKSQICAIKYNNIIDGGEVYFRSNILLKGTANEIFQNIFDKITVMITKIIKRIPKSKKQKGKVTIFKRRKPFQSRIDFNTTLFKLYDFIRMLDLDFKDFPKAFLNEKKYKLTFSKPTIKGKKEIICKVSIKKN